LFDGFVFDEVDFDGWLLGFVAIVLWVGAFAVEANVFANAL